MEKRFQEYKSLDLAAVARKILAFWHQDATFEKSVKLREGAPSFVFYEGPPSANGLPGIHHVLSRSIKDAICRYRTQAGYRVERKAGWDTHGLPVELGVETMLGITKEDIGKKISVEEYNSACRREVMKYTDRWRELTELMGYWIDMDHPYITYQNQYIETLWYLLKRLYEAGVLYKGKTIQPYSPAAGTGLSTHELNQPGCYCDVQDTTVVAQFRAVDAQGLPEFEGGLPLFYLAWTTTPWTLPSNTALAVGERYLYDYVRTFNVYTGQEVVVVVAHERLNAYFKKEGSELPMRMPEGGKGIVPWRVERSARGEVLAGKRYEQLIDWIRPTGRAFEVIVGDFVTTDDGTGIVHIAPTFGADDARVAKLKGIGSLLAPVREDAEAPMVDKRGRLVRIEDLDPAFVNESVNVQEYRPWAGRFVKSSYATSNDPMGGELDVDIAVMLKQRGQAFKVEKHTHSYPHCWRTDKPILYYPLDSWFIKTTAFKQRLMELNATINWKPESTGSGRFGKWLENLVDWNLSRSRFWGTPLPIWVTEDRAELRCIGSLEELKAECEKAVRAGVMRKNPLAEFRPNDFSDGNYSCLDLHRPFVDSIVLVSSEGKPMYREPDLVDVWFDSGAMPYAQLHYPFENQELFSQRFPADFVAEGVDQTRGWFFTLHAIATMLFDSVAFKNIVSNGLVLDKKGNKMSKRLGNATDPFEAMRVQGADAVRWYMLTNAQPWDNLKFDMAGVEEAARRFFGTLYNTYSFFALYANVDGFTGKEPLVPLASRPELDRWILSSLNTLVREVRQAFEEYEPTRAGRAIQEFTIEQLSNWYVRLNRKRFWGGGLDEDKLAAYQTLFSCLETISRLMAPLAPFYAENLYRDLHGFGDAVRDGDGLPSSVHCTDFPQVEDAYIDAELEQRMRLAQSVCSMVLALRRKVSIKVRQPLGKIMIPILDEAFGKRLDAVSPIILNEVNVKEVERIGKYNTLIVKRVKADFKRLGPRFGKGMKELSNALECLSQDAIAGFEQRGFIELTVGGTVQKVSIDEVEIRSEDIPGWLVASDGVVTVALDVTLTEPLIAEGAARELVNKVQNLRKESNFNITDRIVMAVVAEDNSRLALQSNWDYVQQQTLCVGVDWVSELPVGWPMVTVELDYGLGDARVAVRQAQER